MALLTAVLLFEAGATSPAFVMADEPRPAPPSKLRDPDPNVVPLVIEQPPAPIRIEGSGSALIPAQGIELRAQGEAHRPPAIPEEVEELRGPFSRVTAQPDGTHTAEFFMGRVNFQDTAGDWQPIDLTLVDEADGSYGLRTRANDVALRVTSRANSDALAELEHGGRILRLRQLDRSPTLPVQAADRVRVPGRPGQGAVDLIPTPEGLEFTVTLDSAFQANAYQFVLDTGGLSPEVGPEGRGILLRDDSGQIVATVSPPTVFDATERPAPMRTVTTVLSSSPEAAPSLPPPSEEPANPTEAPRDEFDDGAGLVDEVLARDRAVGALFDDG